MILNILLVITVGAFLGAADAYLLYRGSGK